MARICLQPYGCVQVSKQMSVTVEIPERAVVKRFVNGVAVITSHSFSFPFGIKREGTDGALSILGIHLKDHGLSTRVSMGDGRDSSSSSSIRIWSCYICPCMSVVCVPTPRYHIQACGTDCVNHQITPVLSVSSSHVRSCPTW